MPETTTENPAERQVLLMRSDLANGFDDLLGSLRSVTTGGGRLAVSGGNIVEREINMAVSLSEEIRSTVISSEALTEARAQPLYGRLRSDGHRLVDLLADVSGVTVQGAVRTVDRFFAQRPALAEPSQGNGDDGEQTAGPSSPST